MILVLLLGMYINLSAIVLSLLTPVFFIEFKQIYNYHITVLLSVFTPFCNLFNKLPNVYDIQVSIGYP